MPLVIMLLGLAPIVVYTCEGGSKGKRVLLLHIGIYDAAPNSFSYTVIITQNAVSLCNNVVKALPTMP